MSERDHIISNPSDAQTGKLGKRFPENNRTAYPRSPIHSGEMTDETVRAAFVEGVQNGDSTAAFTAHGNTVESGTGNRFARIDMDFGGSDEDKVPDIAGMNPGTEGAVTQDGRPFGEGGGAPTTQYIPPLTSPGPGSIAPGDQPAFSGVTKDPAQNVEFGSGIGGLANPAETSPEIAKQDVDTATALLSGRSFATSNG